MMSQLFRDLDFGTGSEPRHRIMPVGAVVVLFNLEHGGLLKGLKDAAPDYMQVSCQQ